MKIMQWVRVFCAVVSLLFLAFVIPPVRQQMEKPLAKVLAPWRTRNRNEAIRVGEDFFEALARNDWTRARSFLTADCQQAISVDTLRQKWYAINAKDGANGMWERSEKRSSLFPDFIENDYLIRGKRYMSKASLRLVRENGEYRIEKLTLTP